MNSEQRVKIIRTEGDQAILKLENGQELRWKAESLPDTLKNGDEALLRLISKKSALEGQDQLAEQVLNELLRS